MKRISLRARLMILMICLTSLPVVTVTWIATINTRESVEKELIGANASRMLWADQYLSELIDQIDALFYTLQINRNLAARLGTESGDSGTGAPLLAGDSVRDTLTGAFYANARKIDRLTLYDHATGSALSVSFADSGSVRRLDIQDSAWRRIAGEPVAMYFKQTADGIYAYHSINRFPDRKFLGGISVGINDGVWREVAQILKSESESYVFLMNDEGELLSGSTPRISSPEVLDQIHRLVLPDKGLVFRQDDHFFYFMERVGGGQLTVVKAIPVATVKASALPTIRAGILTGSLFVAASILLSILFSLRITRPIVSLARSMRVAQVPSFEMKFVGSFDEIGLLQHGYNSMMQRIKELIEHEYQREIEIKNAQLLALQAQINPHFLNNTLNLIGGMALVKKAPEIYKITRIMGDLLRYSISSGDETVMLQDELAHIRNYLYIQEQRFTGRCSVDIDTDPDVMDCRLPRFILQPIVENAFEHGLQPKQGDWRLRIRTTVIRETVAIFIQDFGAGMTDERLRLLRLELKGGSGSVEPPMGRNKPKRRPGIGVRNVHTRLQLHFGEPYGIRIFSRVRCGTLIALTFPYSRGVDRTKGVHTDV